jgi:hypothetical protein
MIHEDYGRVSKMDTLFLLEDEQEFINFEDNKIIVHGTIEERTVSQSGDIPTEQDSPITIGLKSTLPF